MTHLDRRTLMKSAALGAAVSALPLRAAAAAPAAAAEDPFWLLHPLRPHQPIAFGWRLGGSLREHRGARVLTLEHEGGETAEIHVCAHGGVPRGVAHTGRLDLLLMDGGDGDHATAEATGRIARYLATVIAANEALPGAAEQIAGLMTHSERLFRFGAEGLL